MATDFIMPRVPDQHQHQHRHQPSVYYPRQHQPQSQHPQRHSTFPQIPNPAQFPPPTQYNPQISPLSTSGNASPTSPKNYLGRPIRPMYMPAVLRPTEHPSKAPLARPRPDEDALSDELTSRPNSSFSVLSALGGRLSRRSTGDSGKCIDGSWNMDLFPKPTGSPTRQHWKPDQESDVCDDVTCLRRFNTWTRRHHCRKCGNIFCDSHSSKEVPLDQDAAYNPRGQNSRACDHCYAQFKQWRSRANSQSSSLTSSDGNLADHPTTPVVASPASIAAMRLPHSADAAQSVPRDWNWSTF